MATAVEERARPPPRMMAPGPCTADSADTVAAISAVVRTTCVREAPRLHCPRAWTHPVRSSAQNHRDHHRRPSHQRSRTCYCRCILQC